MALALPNPTTCEPSGAAQTRTQTRAYRQWEAGQAHAQREHWLQAAQAFEQAYSLHDDDAYALHAAHALIRAGRADVALKRTQVLRRGRPVLSLAYTLESHALLERGDPEQAVACLRALPDAAPRDHAYHVSLAVALQRCKRNFDAIQAYMQALALKMNDGLSHFRMGICFKDLGMKIEAAECLRTALIFGVGSSELAARGLLAFLEREGCRWSGAELAIKELREAVAALPEDGAVETSPFPHAVLVDDPLELLKVCRHYTRHAATAWPPLPRRNARAHEGRLRIGYLSVDFHQHATSQLMVQMLESHDRSRYEVTVISGGVDDGSPMRHRIEAACEHFVNVAGLTHQAMAQRIRAQKIDILVDAKGATDGTLMPVVAQRPAPLQVSWLAFPGTSGAPYIDYFIGDPVVAPLEHAAHFSEKIAQMPHCYQPNDAHRAVPRCHQPNDARRADWGLPDGAVALCAFHQSYKISAEVFDRWCEVLRAVPNAVLWLMLWNTNVETALLAAARERGIDPARLVFAPFVAAEDHLSRLACADLYLDAWPCNAHTTAGESLWVGVPVLTLQGPTFAQRVAASLLHAVGLDELVCHDADTYVQQAIALAGDAARRASLRQHLLAQRTASPLFDGARFARDIEGLYDRMWQRAVAGLPPEHLPAQL